MAGPSVARNSSAPSTPPSIGVTGSMRAHRTATIVPRERLFDHAARTMQRKPTWHVDVSIGSGKRAAGR